MKCWLLAGLLVIPAVSCACPLTPQDGEQVAEGELKLAWRAEPAPIRNGEPFSLLVKLCPAEAALVRVDATMPEHRHGMNYKPTIKSLGGGRWQVEGLLWHMAGRWALRWDVDNAGRDVVLDTSVQLR